MQKRVMLAGAIMGAALLTGCGKTASASSATTQAPPTTEVAATTTTMPATVTSAPPGSGGPVPNVTGKSLDLAEGTLRSDSIGYKVYGGGALGVIVPENWTVCSQNPTSGTATAVNLVVARSCS